MYHCTLESFFSMGELLFTLYPIKTLFPVDSIVYSVYVLCHVFSARLAIWTVHVLFITSHMFCTMYLCHMYSIIFNRPGVAGAVLQTAL